MKIFEDNCGILHIGEYVFENVKYELWKPGCWNVAINGQGIAPHNIKDGMLFVTKNRILIFVNKLETV